MKDKLLRLESEKEEYLKIGRFIYAEDNCRFGKASSNNKWPLLGGRYQLVKLLGKGGFSEVYKAFDLQELEYVACKVHQLNSNWKARTRSNYIKHALRENQVLKAVDHPNIIKHLASIEIDSDSFCTVIEYCEDSDLSSYIQKQKSLSEKEVKSIIKQILNGLRFLNDTNKKIIHYDLKPPNILLHRGLVKLSDFGLCKIIGEGESKLELTSQGVGTYWYLPPECFRTNCPVISTKVDMWSVGVIFYELLYGKRPFNHSVSQENIIKQGLMLKMREVEFPSKPNVSAQSKQFIKRCLEYIQEKRIDVFEAIRLMNH